MEVNPALPKSIGKYEILGLVGRGGMGVLYRARDTQLERDVAVKMMLVNFSTDPTARERFQREARAVARLQHRNVVTIHELGEVDATPYIVMELLSGTDLDGILRGSKPLTLAAKLDIGIQLCEGLAYAHDQGIVHRDIKPANIRVLEDGNVKILDFGIARFVNNTLTQSGTIMGTPSYMAPEQILGQSLDGRADLFSVGVLLYELLSGTKPFSGDSPTAVAYQIVNVEPMSVRAVVPDLPDGLQDVVAHALKKRVQDRYQKAGELASDLRMIRTTVDPTLNVVAAPGTRTGHASITLGPLHATSRSRTPTHADETVLDVKMATPAPAGAKVVPRTGSFNGAVLGIAAVAVLAVAGIAWWAVQKNQTAQNAPSAASGRTSTPTSTADTPTPPATPVPAPAAPPELLAVSSVPPGAHLILNGTDTGKVTPAAVSLPAQGARKLELSLKGYQPLTATITGDDIKAGSREFRLAREAGAVKLSVSWDQPFEVVQGSRVLSPAAKEHEITVQPGGGPVQARSKALLLNATLSIDFQRSKATVELPASGTLAVYASPSLETCPVSVDGQSLGFPPIARQPIASGPHTVTLGCAGARQERKVTVGSGERTTVQFAAK